MKKALFLASALMALSMAVTVSAAVDGVSSEGGIGDIQKTQTEQAPMLAVNAGDVINIKVTGATGDITLLSAKVGETESNDTIQYVNQYDSTQTDISYTVRELPDKNGIYYLKINDGTNTATYYYKYGRPESVTSEGVSYYTKVNFGDVTSAAYVATFSLNGATVNEVGYEIGVEGGKSVTQKTEISPISGEGDIAFGITVYNIPTTDFNTQISNLTVSPFVNFTTTEAAE